MITLSTVIITCFVIFPIGKWVYGLQEDNVDKKRAVAWRYQSVFKAVDVSWEECLNINDKGYIKKP